MIFPSIDELMKNVDSKYTLAMVVAKRARQLVDGAAKLAGSNSDKLVTTAIHEVYEGKIIYVRPRDEIKQVNEPMNEAVGDNVKGTGDDAANTQQMAQ